MHFILCVGNQNCTETNWAQNRWKVNLVENVQIWKEIWHVHISASKMVELKLEFFIQTSFMSYSHHNGSHCLKKKRNFMKTFHKMVTPPLYCFYEILILIFFSLF